MPIKVLIVDDQAMVRMGLRLILDSEPDFEVVGEAADGRDAIHETAALQPDLVLLDIRMPVVNGIEAARTICMATPEAKVVMLTTFDADEYVFDALKAGASAFLLKDVPPERLVAALRLVAEGESLLAPQITRRLINSYTSHYPPGAADPSREGLTQREGEVLSLIAAGLSNSEIASALVLSEATVKTHVARVLDKLGVRDRVHAVIWAYEHGFVQG